MATAAETLARRIAALERRTSALSRARQVAHSTIDVDGRDMTIPDAVGAGVRAEAIARQVEADLAEAREILDRDLGELAEKLADALPIIEAAEERLVEAEEAVRDSTARVDAAEERLDEASGRIDDAFGRLDTQDQLNQDIIDYALGFGGVAINARDTANEAHAAAGDARSRADTAITSAADAKAAADAKPLILYGRSTEVPNHVPNGGMERASGERYTSGFPLQLPLTWRGPYTLKFAVTAPVLANSYVLLDMARTTGWLFVEYNVATGVWRFGGDGGLVSATRRISGTATVEVAVTADRSALLVNGEPVLEHAGRPIHPVLFYAGSDNSSARSWGANLQALETTGRVPDGLEVSPAVLASADADAYQSSEWAASGQNSLKLIGSSAGGSTEYARFIISGLTPGAQYTALGTVRLGATRPSTIARTLSVRDHAIGSGIGSAIAPDAEGVYPLAATFTAPAGGAVRLHMDMRDSAGATWFWDDLAIVPGAVQNDGIAFGEGVAYIPEEPAGTAPQGSIWWARDESGRIVAQWQQTAPGEGATWEKRELRSEAIAGLDVGKLTAGSAAISDLVAQRIAASSGQFLELDVSQLNATDANLKTAVAEKIAAASGQFLQLDASQLTASSATLDEAVVNKLWSEAVVAKLAVADKVIAGEALIDGAVTADKLAARAVTAAKLDAGAVTADKIDANAINGKVITGATIRTAASGARVQLNGSDLRVINSDGQTTARMSPEITTGLQIAQPGTSSLRDLGAVVFGATPFGVSDSDVRMNHNASTPVGSWSNYYYFNDWTTWTAPTNRALVTGYVLHIGFGDRIIQSEVRITLGTNSSGTGPLIRSVGMTPPTTSGGSPGGAYASGSISDILNVTAGQTYWLYWGYRTRELYMGGSTSSGIRIYTRRGTITAI